MKVSTEIDNNFGYEKITQLVDNIPLIYTLTKTTIQGMAGLYSANIEKKHMS
jgi:hypothetical protein